MYNGVDVYVRTGEIDWKKVRAAGVRFAMIKASQGYTLSGDSYLFEDRNFRKNIVGATNAGLYCGSWHYLTASCESKAICEAQHYLSIISRYRSRHLLWAAVDVEEGKYLPSTPDKLCAVVDTFCREVAKANFIPMVYTNPNYIRYKFKRVPGWDLWLALWRDKTRVPTDYPRMRIWQYGTEAVNGVSMPCDADIGTFWMPEQDYKA